MDGDAIVIISRCARLFLISHIALGLLYYVMISICELRKSWKLLFLFQELRQIIHVFVTEVLSYYFGTELWYKNLWTVYSVVFGLSGIMHAVYFFKGPLYKRLLACMIGEIFGIGVLMASWAIMHMGGQKEIFVMTGQMLRLEDIWVIGIGVLLGVLCCSVLRPLLRQFRSYEIKHVWILMLVEFIWICAGLLSNLESMNSQATYVATTELVAAVMLCVFTAFLLRKNVLLEKVLYAEQRQFAETHLAMLQEQASWVSENREQLKAQIQMVEAEERKHAGNKELIREYLEELKSRYENFQAGVYCDDRMVDALLCFKEKVCHQQEIETDFHLQKYDRGNVEEQDVVKVLLSLLDYAIYECMNSGKADGFEKKIHMDLSYIKGQLLVNLSFCGKRKFAKSGIKSVLRKYDGTVHQKSSKEGQKIQVMLNCKK